MRALTAQELLLAWEQGEGQHPLDRALTLLGIACPEMSWEELAHLSIGERDELLLALRERMLGRKLDGYTACPACGERLEFSMDTAAMRTADGAETGDVGSNAQNQPLGGFLEVGGVALRFRPPDSLDLAAVAGCPDLEVGRNLLLRRCITQARQGDVNIAVEVLPACATEALIAQFSERQSLAELILDLDCPGCGHQWTTLLDIASFFWSEISALARRLLGEVHVLARIYGWSEAEILALSSTRRALYLELVNE